VLASAGRVYAGLVAVLGVFSAAYFG